MIERVESEAESETDLNALLGMLVFVERQLAGCDPQGAALVDAAVAHLAEQCGVATAVGKPINPANRAPSNTTLS